MNKKNADYVLVISQYKRNKNDNIFNGVMLKRYVLFPLTAGVHGG